MFKKSLIALSVFMLAACSSRSVDNSQQPLYKISDQEMKKIIFLQNNIEQCIYPQLKGLSYAEAERQVYQKKSKAEDFVFIQFLNENIKSVIGEKNFTTLVSDEKSLNYFIEQQDKLNNQDASVNEAECKAVKKEYDAELKLAQDKIKRARQCQCYNPNK